MHPDPDHTDRLARAFETLKTSLTPYVRDAMQAVYGERWRAQAEEGLPAPYPPHKAWDAHALLLMMSNNWNTVFHPRLGETGRLLVGELRAVHDRNAPGDLSPADAYRVLDTAARLLLAVGDAARAEAVQQDALAVMRFQFQQQAAPPPPAAAVGDTVELPRAGEPVEQPVPDDASRAAPEEQHPEQENGVPRATDPPEATPPGTDALPLPAEPEEEVSAEEDEPERTASGLRGWFGRFLGKADEDTLEPLELRTRLLDAVEHALKRFRSTRPLPFNRITVHVLAPTSSDRLTYASALDDLDPPFEQAVRHRLHDTGFDLPDALGVTTKIHDRAPRQLEAAFAESGPIYVDLKQHVARTTATITVVKGVAEKATYRIRSTARTNIGRLSEVVEDRYGHIVRRNDVAFLDHTTPDLDAEDRAVNETVSRRHARIEFDARAGAFTLLNEQGVTSVSRLGFPHPVRVTHQPVPLQDGDLIYLGRACLRFETRRRG